jgi:K+-transporting ATPase ATPase A chain
MTDAGRAGILNPGAHGFSEVLYAFSSAANNNGSAFAGLSANTPFYNVRWASPCGLAASPSSCRCWPWPARWRRKSASPRLRAPAALPTHGPLFVVLIGTVLLVGLLNYVPALALGPVVEHLNMLWAGHSEIMTTALHPSR